MNLEIQFKALNDVTRREIINMLSLKSLTAGQISDAFSISKPSISHHLELLKRADLILSKRKGQFIHYSLNREGYIDIFDWFSLLKPKDYPPEKPRIRLPVYRV